MAVLLVCVLVALIVGIKLGTIVGMEYRQALRKTSQWFRASHPFRGQAAAEVHKHKLALEKERARNNRLARWLSRLRHEIHTLQQRPRVKERRLIGSMTALSAFMLTTGFCLGAGLLSFSEATNTRTEPVVDPVVPLPVDRPRVNRPAPTAFNPLEMTMTVEPKWRLRIPMGRRWPEEELSVWPSVSYDIRFYWPIESDLGRPKIGPTDAALEHAWIRFY